MSISSIYESSPIARKEYSCNACDFIFALDDLFYIGLTFAEKRSIVKAKQKKYKILKGEKYERQFNTDGIHAWTFRAIPEMHKICIKHDLYKE